jgi:hypothetical protein
MTNYHVAIAQGWGGWSSLTGTDTAPRVTGGLGWGQGRQQGRGGGCLLHVEWETAVAIGPVVVPVAKAVVSLPLQAHRRSPGECYREAGPDELAALRVHPSPFAGEELCELLGSSSRLWAPQAIHGKYQGGEMPPALKAGARYFFFLAFS